MTLDRDTLVALAHAIADVLEKREAGSPEPPLPSKPAKKAAAPRKRRRALPAPPAEVTDLDVARARAAARRAGIIVR